MAPTSWWCWTAAQARSGRVYLTATLSDDSVLVTNLNASPKDLAEVVTPPRPKSWPSRAGCGPVMG
ncbi:hypothetical protein [Alloactinosynnema sp. L-07]|nr:hypothetical protein [Alloactinosynnema sp. L-07]